MLSECGHNLLFENLADYHESESDAETYFFVGLMVFFGAFDFEAADLVPNDSCHGLPKAHSKHKKHTRDIGHDDLNILGSDAEVACEKHETIEGHGPTRRNDRTRNANG